MTPARDAALARQAQELAEGEVVSTELPIVRELREENARLREALQVQLRPVTAAKVSMWYMHDCHLFTRVHAGELGPWGTVEGAILLNEDGKEVRRVAVSLHTTATWATPDQEAAWIAAHEADPDVCRLLAARAAEGATDHG